MSTEPVYITPIAEAHVLSFHACLDAVARERRYLAIIEAPPLAQVLAFVKENIAADAAQFVALAGERVVGWADVLPTWKPALAHTGSLGMGVLAPYRGRGLGSALLAACRTKAQQRGITRIELEARIDNLNAIRLYEKSGFVREGVKRNGMRFDNVYFDTLLMGCLLEPAWTDRARS